MANESSTLEKKENIIPRQIVHKSENTSEAASDNSKPSRAQWFWPLLTTIFVAFLTASGAIIGNLVQGSNALKLEGEKAEREQKLQKQKQEAELILQAIRTQRSEDARANLIFLVQAGLITLPPDQIEKLTNSEIMPLLPPVVFNNMIGTAANENSATEQKTSANTKSVKNIQGNLNHNSIDNFIPSQPTSLPKEAVNEQLTMAVIERMDNELPSERRLDNSESIVDEAELSAIVPSLSAEKAKLYLPLLQKAMTEFGITKRLRQAAFLASLSWRSNQYSNWEEKDGSRYEGMKRFGNDQPGDGHKYRARGPMMIIGRKNYERIGKIIGVDLVNNPDLMATPEIGFRAAGAFWQAIKMNERADRESVIELYRTLNGPALYTSDGRVQYYYRAKRHLTVNDE
jgi:predicted chitinase